MPQADRKPVSFAVKMYFHGETKFLKFFCHNFAALVFSTLYRIIRESFQMGR